MRVAIICQKSRVYIYVWRRKVGRKRVCMSLENDSNVNENSIADVVRRYRGDVEKLTPYLPWLETHATEQVAESYGSEQLSHSVSFPVYDSTLLAFVKQAQQTNLLDRNYVYIYTQNRIKSAQDELRFIQRAQIMDMAALAGILSKYIMSGMVKGTVWAEGVNNRVLYSVVAKMQELIKFWGSEKN